MLELTGFNDYTLEGTIDRHRKKGMPELKPASHSTKPGLLIVTKPFIPAGDLTVTAEELSVYNENFARTHNTAAVDKDPGHRALKKAMMDPLRFLHHILAATNARNQYPHLSTQNRLDPLEQQAVFKERLVDAGEGTFRKFYLLSDWVFTFNRVFGDHLELKHVVSSGEEEGGLPYQTIHGHIETITDGNTYSLINRRRTMAIHVGPSYPIDYILTRQATYWNEGVKAGTYA